MPTPLRIASYRQRKTRASSTEGPELLEVAAGIVDPGFRDSDKGDKIESRSLSQRALKTTSQESKSRHQQWVRRAMRATADRLAERARSTPRFLLRSPGNKPPAHD